MAQQNINSATAATTITGSDSVFISKNDNTLQKIDYDLLAKAIIEQYTGSTLGGSARSLKTAIDALNSKTSYTPFDTGDDLNDFIEKGWYSSSTSAITSSLLNCPATGSGFALLIPFAAPIIQLIFIGGASGKMYMRARTSSGWGPWWLFQGETV